MEIEEGGFYVFEWGDGTWGNVKVLRVEDDGVHVRLYPNVYLQSPIGWSPDELKSNATRDGRTIGHVPVSRRLFEAWNPVIWVRQAIKAEELDGYNIWREARGGLFDLPTFTSAKQIQRAILGIADDEAFPWKDLPSSN